MRFLAASVPRLGMSNYSDEESCILMGRYKLSLPDTPARRIVSPTQTCSHNVDVVEYESDDQKHASKEEKYPKLSCEADREVTIGCPDGDIIHSHHSLD